MKKGFTLIELLAVIIILAILMIIAVPNILSTLSTARSEAFLTQARSIYKTAEQQYVLDTMSGSGSTCYDKNNLSLNSISSTVSFAVNINSETGQVSNIAVTDTGQSLTASGTTMNGIALTTYNSSALSCSGSQQSTFGGTLVAATSGDTHKGMVYLDPKDLTATCTSTSTLTTTNTGCKKFYIYDDSGTTYKMIMWKNTTATVAWNSSNSNSTPNEVATTLSSNTNGWQGSPRLITADEVAGIVGITNATTATPPGTAWASSKGYGTTVSTQSSWFYFDGIGMTYSSSDGWQKLSVNSNNKSKYTWLYDYTNGCTSYGCNIADTSNYGYWTSTPVSGSTKLVWFVHNEGNLIGEEAKTANSYGLRPVIEFLKSSIS